MSFAICSMWNFWKLLLSLFPEFYFYIYFSFLFNPSFSRSIFSAETLFSYQWRTFIYFLPIKFYRKRALHLKVFLTQLGSVDIRFSFRGNTIFKYLRFLIKVSYLAKITNATVRIVFYNLFPDLTYYIIRMIDSFKIETIQKKIKKNFEDTNIACFVLLLFFFIPRSSIIQNLIT